MCAERSTQRRSRICLNKPMIWITFLSLAPEAPTVCLSSRSTKVMYQVGGRGVVSANLLAK